jgi:poly(A) polymerase
MTTEREFALEVVRKLRDAGFEALWAGGCVRDQVLRLEPHDYDVATNARPEQVQKLFRRTVAVGVSFGVVEVLGPKVDEQFLKVQVATFRVDGPYDSGRWPMSVRFCSAEEDARRRDFTINGMFFDPVENRLIDYVGGQADLNAKILRAIGNPRERFGEDKLRLLRAVRFAARFELTIEPATAEAIREMAPQITIVSAERIAEELRKLLTNRNRVRGMRLMGESRLMEPILPELKSATSEMWEQTLRVLAQLPEQVDFPLALAALLQGHIDAEQAAEIGERLKLSNAERDRICWLVENHGFLHNAPQMRKSKLKPILIHPGIQDLFTLQRAIAPASGTSAAYVDFAEARLQEWSTNGELNPPFLITGDDLKQLGIPPGPQYKRLLDAVREAQLDNDISSTVEAIELVKRVHGQAVNH